MDHAPFHLPVPGALCPVRHETAYLGGLHFGSQRHLQLPLGDPEEQQYGDPEHPKDGQRQAASQPPHGPLCLLLLVATRPWGTPRRSGVAGHESAERLALGETLLLGSRCWWRDPAPPASERSHSRERSGEGRRRLETRPGRDEGQLSPAPAPNGEPRRPLRCCCAPRLPLPAAAARETDSSSREGGIRGCARHPRRSTRRRERGGRAGPTDRLTPRESGAGANRALSGGATASRRPWSTLRLRDLGCSSGTILG